MVSAWVASSWHGPCIAHCWTLSLIIAEFHRSFVRVISTLVLYQARTHWRWPLRQRYRRIASNTYTSHISIILLWTFSLIINIVYYCRIWWRENVGFAIVQRRQALVLVIVSTVKGRHLLFEYWILLMERIWWIWIVNWVFIADMLQGYML